MRTIEEVKNDSPFLVKVYDNVFTDEYRWVAGRTTGNVKKEFEEIEVSISGQKTTYYHIGDEVRFKELSD